MIELGKTCSRYRHTRMMIVTQLIQSNSVWYHFGEIA